MFRSVAGIEVEFRIVGDVSTSRTVMVLSIDGKVINPPIEVVLGAAEWNALIYRKQQELT